MKKLLIGLLFAGISVLGGNLPSSGDRPQIPYPLARGGRALCSIVLPENAQEFTRMAAEDLKYFLGAITGAEFAVVPEWTVVKFDNTNPPKLFGTKET